MDVREKVVVVSGASSGIGQAMAVILAAKGSKVVMLARRTDRLMAMEAELKAAHHEVLAVPTDVTNRDQVNRAVDLTREIFGRIDVVVNNAGIGYFGTVEKLPIEDFRHLIQTNVYGMLNLIQSSIPSLKETHGTIVNVSSVLSKRALPFLSAYASTKSMMNALADGLRLELRTYGVHVLTYCAPETETEFHATTKHEAGLDPTPGGYRRKASARDVAARIVQALVEDKREVVESKTLEILNWFAPKFLDAIFYKSMVQKVLKSQPPL
ncbi:SDR family NAD(P)-dependent oxidoreductase [Sulfobacillus harzensis]|uniref:SDR family NAD(P)-dependent oxidoreductase n=1 Tax=Sulfobacillus harzensis TaxID=2729629 RepID=A0A7Y0L335_9FIRM|nr:SDR family NAD(P)-dependent oxidoreductase [Sulfobacillus harzensis]NMP21495.1 SDR family NAD(P)-dependent oxidoreductase [Sulfobacillus harzensis]